MTTHASRRGPVSTRDARSDATSLTRRLLACGIIAGPLYLVVGFAQAFLRPGFDPAHNDLSVLANGDLGWIQITNLTATGLLTLLFAIGLRRALRGGQAGTGGPILLGLYAVGLVAAGIFVADPMNGFPPGTPPGHATSTSLHGLGHFVSGGVGFLGLIAGAFVLARRFRADGHRGLGAFSILTGICFLAAFLGIATGSTSAVVVLSFTAAVVLAWAWIAVVAATLRRNVAATAS